MNILFILGNGFDLNLGLKTSYQDFYDFYKSIATENDNLIHLKKDISKNFKNWSDLELAIGNYTDNVNSLDEFDLFFDDLSEKLSQYIGKQENEYDFTQIDKNKLFEYFSKPEKFLLPADEQNILTFKNTWNNHHWNTNIITFNYTRTVEKIIGDKYEGVEIGKQRNSLPIMLSKIEHIHGYWNDRMILGVNDVRQVKNKKLHNNQDIIESIIKTDCNKALKHAIDQSCIAKIKNAHLICIFGSSLGATDNFWWELIGRQLKRESFRLIIFDKGPKIPSQFSRKTSRYERAKRKLFLDKTKLSDLEKNKLSDKILVGYNTDMFKLN